MRVLTQELDETIEMCPHCNVQHVHIQVIAFFDWDEKTWCMVGSCRNRQCRKSVMFLCENKNDGAFGPVKFIYPFPDAAPFAPGLLPAKIADEFQEAIKCMAVGSYLASMTMSRRVLQRCLADKGFDQHRLVDQIDAAKAANLVHPRFNDLVDEIRHYGNIGAHPDDDKDVCVTRENCEHLIEFTKLIIEDFFVLPAKAAKLKRTRTT